MASIDPCRSDDIEGLVDGLSSFSGKVCCRLPPSEKVRARTAGIEGTADYMDISAMVSHIHSDVFIQKVAKILTYLHF